MTGNPRPDITRTTLQLLFVGMLIAGTLWILRPFLIPLTWAATIVVATWPLYCRVRQLTGERRPVAVAVMTILLLLLLVIPMYLAVSTIIENADWIVDVSKTVTTLSWPQPPSWLEGIPVVGAPLTRRWQEIAAATPEQLSETILPYSRMLVAWFVARVGGVGMIVVQFLLTAVIAAILYTTGERAAAGVERFAHRLAGPRGSDAVHLAGQAVRAVALGVVVTALVQSLLGGIGLAIAGIHFAAILTAIMFMLGIAQIGPIPVLVPAVAFVFWRDGAVWGTGLLIWSVFVGGIDNLLRPVLIKRGANLPLLLIFAGVLGGLIAWGVIGLFVGPVVLAVSYTLLTAWIDDREA